MDQTFQIKEILIHMCQVISLMKNQFILRVSLDRLKIVKLKII